MTTDNIRGRSAAILLAAVLAAGGTSLLFGDVIFNGVVFSQKHFQTICIVLGTTIASLVAAFAWEHRHWLACLGFIALAASGTAVIVWYSLGRQVDAQMMSAEDHDKAAEQRSRLKTQLEAEEKARTAKRNDADAVCKKLGPDHKRCLGARAVEGVYTDSIAGLEARLAALKVKPADASAEAFGKLAAALGFNADKAKALALLLMPYFITGLFELGLAMSLHYAFRPGHQPKPMKAVPSLPPTQLGAVTDAELSNLRAGFATDPVEASKPPKGPNGGLGSTIRTPKGPNSGSPKGRLSHSEIISDLMLRAATDRLFGSNEEAADNYGYSPSRFSELVTRWEGQNLIPKGRMVGRCKVLAAAD